MLTPDSLAGNPIQALFNVSALFQQPVGTSVTCPIDSILAEGQSSLVTGSVNLTHTGRGIALTGEGEANVVMECTRCLRQFDARVHFKIEEQVHPDPRYAHRRGADGFEEDGEVRIGPDNSLDLGEIIRQHIVLHLPMRPLCRADCPGIREIDLDG